MSNIRINTTPGGSDSYINVKLDQKFDFVEILSLKITQEDVYRKFCSDYGVVVGRVTINNGFGVPNAKVSIFIPVDDIDKEDDQIFGLYPYEQVFDKNSDGYRYNLLPKKNETNNDCFTPIGSFFNKREVQDNDEVLEIYCKYYKFTTTTNNSGDFMIFGVPTGTYQLHVDADISNIGIISQAPYDLIRDGANEKQFQSVGKFKESKNLETLTQLKTKSPISVNVKPFWGDLEQCEIGITRNDIDLATNIAPSAFFIGSIFSDNDKGGINKRCKPRGKMGKMDKLMTGPGTIEMIRKTPDGAIERYDAEGIDLIDENGAWAYQVPMNLDYITTDEYGNIVPTDDPNKGIPTRARVRFRIGMIASGGEGRLRARAKYLVPHNPKNMSEVDWKFNETTKDNSFHDMYWNKIYTVSNHIPGYSKNKPKLSSNGYIGIKDIEDTENTSFPFNSVEMNLNGYPLFVILASFNSVFRTILRFINLIVTFLNFIVEKINWLIKKFGGSGIEYTKYITRECGTQKYCINCKEDSKGFKKTEDEEGPIVSDKTGEIWYNCKTIELAISLNIIQFNFLNDWVNGTLYAFLYKIKRRRRGKGPEKFCDWGASVDNNQNGKADNKLYQSYLFNRCGLNNQSTEVNGGLIKKDVDENEYYYAPIEYNGNSTKFFATKIMSIGSIFDCDWQGLPKFYPYLIETSYNPPLEVPENYESQDPESPGIEESGYDNVGIPPLVAKIGIVVIIGLDQYNNVKRMSELGMGVDEDRRDLDGSPPDGRILNDDIENPWIRGVFTYLNYPKSINTIPLVYIDNGISKYKYDDPFYKEFRGEKTIVQGFPSVNQYNNSYYFYFGLKPGASSMQKLYIKYLPFCQRVVENDLKIIIDKIVDDNINGLGTGSISFHIEGGVGPYTYEWLGPTYGNFQYKCPNPSNSLNASDCGKPEGGTADNPSKISNLLGGSYTLSVVDSNGNQTTTTVNLSGLNSVKCEVQPSPIDASGNGKVKILINGGVSPYKINIKGVTDTSYDVTFNTTQQNYCYGNCTGVKDLPNSINTLPDGQYIVKVTDSGVNTIINGQPTILYTECNKQLLIGKPQNITLSIETTDPNCNGSFGSGLINIIGGVAPYNIEWLLVSTNNQSYKKLENTVISTNIQPTNLVAGNYSITVTDFAGNIQTISAVIYEPPKTIVLISNVYSPGCYFSETGGAKIQINGQNPPYSIEIDGATTLNISNQSNGEINITTLLADKNPYKLKVIDNNGCEIQNEFNVPYPKYGELYVEAFSKTYIEENISKSRIIVRFKGGNGGPYHFRLPNGNWVNLGNPYATILNSGDYNTLFNDYEIYKSTTKINNEDIFEFQFWVTDATPVSAYPFDFEYYLTEKGQQDVYAMFRGKLQLESDGSFGFTTFDSNKGTIKPYGCYTYDNTAQLPVQGQGPKGKEISTPQ